MLCSLFELKLPSKGAAGAVPADISITRCTSLLPLLAAGIINQQGSWTSFSEWSEAAQDVSTLFSEAEQGEVLEEGHRVRPMAPQRWGRIYVRAANSSSSGVIMLLTNAS